MYHFESNDQIEKQLDKLPIWTKRTKTDEMDKMDKTDKRTSRTNRKCYIIFDPNSQMNNNDTILTIREHI